MKRLINMLLAFAAINVVSSCAEQEVINPTYDKPESMADLEYLDKYGPLKSYLNKAENPNFQIGTGINFADYMSTGLYHRVVNSNFNEVTLNSQEMMHGSVVNSEGNLNLGNINNFLTLANASKLSVFGHALVSHTNQNASYLNKQIASLSIENPLSPNMLNKAGLNNGSFSGWTIGNSGSGVAIENIDGLSTIVLRANGNSAPTSLRLTTPQIPVEPGKEYEVIAYIRSDAEGEGRVAFDGLSNNTPSIDWTGTGGPSETFTTGVAWKKLKFRVTGVQGNSLNLHFDLGYKPNVTYYINVASLYVYDPQASTVDPNRVWLEAECANAVGAKWSIHEDPTISGGKYAVVLTQPNLTTTANITTADVLTFSIDIVTQGTYALWARAAPNNPNDIGNDDSFHFRVNNSGWHTFNNGMGSNRDWTWYRMTTYTLAPGKHTVTVSYREDGAKLDKLLLTRVANDTPTGNGGAALNCVEGAINLSKSTEDKRAIIEAEMEKWISGMIAGTKGQIKSWNVVNQPMDDAQPDRLRTGIGKTPASGEFYWQDYIGMEYGVTAFKLARKYADSDTKLFINESGLESSVKTDGLINYIHFMEGKGAVVDGIGAQIDATIGVTQLESIKQSLTKLAATGKLIRISRLDVQVKREGASANVEPRNLTSEERKTVASFYQDLVKSYFEIVPKQQRAGISVRVPADTETLLGLWTFGINQRSHVFGGLANGLAGRDISKDQ